MTSTGCAEVDFPLCDSIDVKEVLDESRLEARITFDDD